MTPPILPFDVPRWPEASHDGGRPAGKRWTALVLAGERPGDAFAQSQGASCKALIEVGGEPMLVRVVSTLLAVPEIERMIVLTQNPERLAPALSGLNDGGRIALARSGDGIAASIAALLDGEAQDWPVLVTTADHPLLTREMVLDFIGGSDGSDFAIGVVERDTILSAYPQSRRTWLKFWRGAYTGANLFALSNRRAINAVRFWQDAERDRKQALKLFWRFGPRLFLRAVTRTISFPRALSRAGLALGLVAMPVVLSAAEAGIDVDKYEDLQLAEAILQTRAGVLPG